VESQEKARFAFDVRRDMRDDLHQRAKRGRK
jgi:hypothetical protein